ncbi:hypothetical protein GCM10022232_12110 [Streptomyces plumbiresistens]|uniref:Uncharacterized protein n=1 Tax=Streptomyces plumbiresistens TaxID=511811 RepID=A0ABP7QGN6_9ACTN
MSSGSDLPLQTTGRRRAPAFAPGLPAAAPTTGIRAVSSAALKCRAIREDWVRRVDAPNCTRKLT